MSVSTLLRPPLLSYRNRLIPPDGNQQFLKTDLLLLLIALIIGGAIYYCLTVLFGSFKEDLLFQTIIAQKIIELTCYAFFVLLILSDTVAAIGGLYVADSATLISTTPVSTLRIFIAKIISISFETGVMLLVFVIPLLSAFWHVYQPHSSLLLVVIGVSFPLLFIPAGIGVILATIFVILSSRLWNRGLLFFLAFSAVLGWGLKRFISLMYLTSNEPGGGLRALVKTIGLFDNPNPIWLPSRWISDLLSSYFGGSTTDIEIYGLLLVASTAVSLTLSYLVFDLLGLRARSASELHRKNRRGGSDLVRQWIEAFYRLLPLPQQLRALVIKDMSSLIRDRALAFQLLMFLGIASLYLLSFRFSATAMQLGAVSQDVFLAFLSSINLTFAGFVLSAVSTRLVYPSVSLEGRAFWLLQITPLNAAIVVRAKFWCWWPMIFIISVSLLATGGACIGLTPLAYLFTLLIAISLSIACTGLAVGMGAVFASFDWESPTQISTSLGTLSLLLGSLLLSALWALPGAAVMAFTMVPQLLIKIGLWQSFLITALSISLIVISCLATAKWALYKGTQSLSARANG